MKHSVITANPPQPELSAVVALYRQGKLDEALAGATQLRARYPRGEIVHNIAGALHAGVGQVAEAIACYDRAVALAPDYFEAWNNRGNALRVAGRLDHALKSFDAAIRLKPDYAEAHVNRGIALAQGKRPEEAIASYDRALAINPASAEAHNNRGNALKDLKRIPEALASYDAAIRLRPNYANAYVNRGNALKDARRAEEAIASYDQAIALAPNLAEAFANRGIVLKGLKRFDEALASHERALQVKPGYRLAMAEAANLRAQMCLWDGPTLTDLPDEGEAIPPFYMLQVDDPERQLACARTWAEARFPAEQAQAFGAPKGDRIRVGYFSADFHNHATMYLMAGLFERHDRSRFEIHAFSYGAQAQDAMRGRLEGAVNAFHDVGHLSDAAIAALARAQGIDIAVDLKGHTEDTRAGLFAHRAAPVQVGYLGFPGTTGAEFIDYMLADAVTVPEGDERFYSERIVRLPGCYQINDDGRAISDRASTRAELGLPEDGFVFCCFNNNYKITPAEFDIWMRLLTAVEGSLLWLLQDNGWAADNLRREAQARGVDPARLLFATRMPMAEHLARQRCADLFLDTFAVNAHTTASDALWAGLPVLSKLGRSFSARVAGSLLHGIGMPELVTETAADYESRAIELARDPTKMDAIRRKLATNRATAPLFDTARTTHAIEQAYEAMHAARA